MNKIICTLILFALFSTGCITATPFNDESARKGMTNLLNATDDDRLNEVWYRMSYVIRDKYNYRVFADNWTEIKEKLHLNMDGQVTEMREIETVDGMQGVVLKITGETQIKELLFVAELDKARFPGETEVVWRFRGVGNNVNDDFTFDLQLDSDE